MGLQRLWHYSNNHPHPPFPYPIFNPQTSLGKPIEVALLVVYNLQSFSEWADTEQISKMQVLLKKDCREQELNPGALGPESALLTTRPPPPPPPWPQYRKEIKSPTIPITKF